MYAKLQKRMHMSNPDDLVADFGTVGIPEHSKTSVFTIECEVSEEDLGHSFGVGLVRFNERKAFPYLHFTNMGILSNKRWIPTKKVVGSNKF